MSSNKGISFAKFSVVENPERYIASSDDDALTDEAVREAAELLWARMQERKQEAATTSPLLPLAAG